MSKIFCINLTYKSPYEDFENLNGFYPDGKTNINYSLLAMRNLLLDNVNTINQLLEVSENISDIIPIGYGMIEVKINMPDVLQKLVNTNVLTESIIGVGSEELGADEIRFSDDEETNQDRLGRINNLTNQNDIPVDFDESYTDSDSESDGLIDDENSKKSIINKLNDIINNIDLDDIIIDINKNE